MTLSRRTFIKSSVMSALSLPFILEHLAQAPVKTLQIKITTTVSNYLKSTLDNKIGQAWTHYQKWLPTKMVGPVKFVRL